MKEKIFRFNNGFIGTMNEFCLKFGTSKEKNYRNALKWVGRRYNVMTALEQEAYERKRKYARPDYRVYTGTNCFYSITKSLFEKLDLPVSKPEIRHDVFVLPEKNLLFFRYISIVRIPCYDFTPIIAPTLDGRYHRPLAGFGCE